MIDLGRHSVLGIGVDAVDYDAAVQRVVDRAARGEAMSVSALAVHGVMTGVLDADHNYRLNQFDLICPDGQPVRWALRWLHGCRLSERVYGPELTLRLCEESAKRGLKIFLFGGTQEMLEGLRESLQIKYPTLQIAGTAASQFRNLSAEEANELAARVRGSGAQLCFVGLGCPRQEVFAYEMCHRTQMPLIAVGAAFAFHAGMLSQAPRWMQRAGLEWLYRLVKEPIRLWRRYLFLNPLYLCLLAFQYVGIFKARTDRGVEPQQEVLFG